MQPVLHPRAKHDAFISYSRHVKPSLAGIRNAAFSPDGRSVLAAGADGAARIYRCEPCGSPDELPALALGRVTRQLTPDERRRYLHETCAETGSRTFDGHGLPPRLAAKHAILFYPKWSGGVRRPIARLNT
jgi:hypothetical protein